MCFRIVTKRRLQQMRQEVKNEVIVEIVQLLRKADRIFLEPVTINAANATIKDCVFFGTDGFTQAIVTVKPPLVIDEIEKTAVL